MKTPEDRKPLKLEDIPEAPMPFRFVINESAQAKKLIDKLKSDGGNPDAQEDHLKNLTKILNGWHPDVDRAVK